MPFPRVRILWLDGAEGRCFVCEGFAILAFPLTAEGFPLPGGRPRGLLGSEASPLVAAGFALAGRPRGRLGSEAVSSFGARFFLVAGRPRGRLGDAELSSLAEGSC